MTPFDDTGFLLTLFDVNNDYRLNLLCYTCHDLAPQKSGGGHNMMEGGALLLCPLGGRDCRYFLQGRRGEGEAIWQRVVDEATSS